MLIQHSANSDWLFSTQSRVLQADWLILENNERATLNINRPYWRRKAGSCKGREIHRSEGDMNREPLAIRGIKSSNEYTRSIKSELTGSRNLVSLRVKCSNGRVWEWNHNFGPVGSLDDMSFFCGFAKASSRGSIDGKLSSIKIYNGNNEIWYDIAVGTLTTLGSRRVLQRLR